MGQFIVRQSLCLCLFVPLDPHRAPDDRRRVQGRRSKFKDVDEQAELVLITRSTAARRREQSLEGLNKLPRKRPFERPEDTKPVLCRYLSIYDHIGLGVNTYEYSDVSGPTLNFQKSQDLVSKNPKIEQKFPSYIENTRKR